MNELIPFYRTKDLMGDPKKVGSLGTIEYYQVPMNFSYGHVRYIILDPIWKAALYDLTGTKAVYPMHLNALRAMGFEMKLVSPPAKYSE